MNSINRHRISSLFYQKMKLFALLVIIFLCLSLFPPSASSENAKEKLKGTHWLRIGKRVKYKHLENLLKGRNR